MAKLVLMMAFGTCLIAEAHAGETWASSNPKGPLGNHCTVDYSVPSGFQKDDALTAKGNALAILTPEKGPRTRSIAIDFKPMEEKNDSFEKYRDNELNFIKQYKVVVDVQVLKDEHFVKGESATIFEKWVSKKESKFRVFKKVYRIKRPDGYYSISVNADSENLLDEYPFPAFLSGVALSCGDK